MSADQIRGESMARKARIKRPNSIYHVMARSIPEVELFQDKKDKEKYLELMKEYQDIHDFKVYGYCLMDNHVHIMMDPNGADISRIMHCIDTAYARYFNKRHGRRGHLFDDRFKSKIVINEMNLKVLSIYIHNNPRAMKRFRTKPEKYFYSSLGIYIGKHKDKYDLVETSLVLSRFGECTSEAIKNYKNVIFKERDNRIEDEDTLFKEQDEEKYEFIRREKRRSLSFDEILKCINENKKWANEIIELKDCSSKLKAVIVILVKRHCEMKVKDIAQRLGGISESRISQLSKIGFKLRANPEYHKYFSEIESKLRTAN